MKVERAVFISDIHSNLEALQAVLSQAPGLPVYCLGDIVGYGASPNEVLELLMQRKAACIIGNHDNAVLTHDVGDFNPVAAVAAAWNSRTLSDENRILLASFPKERTVQIGENKVYMTHGSPDDNLWEYVLPETHADVFEAYFRKLDVNTIALGHTHMPFVWSEKGKTVFNPGSVGQPRNGNPRASYALLTADGDRISVDHKTAQYDVAASAKKITEARLPEVLATRLFTGN